MKKKPTFLAELVCDGGAKTWRDGRCAYGRCLVRSHVFHAREKFDFAGRFGTEQCAYAEWMALLRGCRKLREEILRKKENPRTYMALIYMDCLPIIHHMMTSHAGQSSRTLHHKKRVEVVLDQFGAFQFHWVSGEYIKKVLGC